MSAPLKPWESNTNLHNFAQSPSASLSSSSPVSAPTVFPSTQSNGNEMIQGAGRPPLPPRPDTQTSYGAYASPYGASSMAGYGGMFSPTYGGGFGSNFAGGYSPYNRMSYGGYGMNDINNSFVQEAESSARGAFQSVESVVSAVSSISMMLESTYFALHNSFRAVLGVADQFSRLKMQLTQVAASFAAFRFLRWLYKRLLVLLRLRQAGLPEDVWKVAVKQSAEEAQTKFPGQDKASWPIVLFFAIAIGGPYLIWRMLSNITSKKGCTSWADGSSEHVVGECKFDFTGEKEDELSFTVGQRIILAPAEQQPRLRQNDWLVASVNNKIGVVPSSYIRILGRRKGIKAKPKLAIAEDSEHKNIPGITSESPKHTQKLTSDVQSE